MRVNYYIVVGEMKFSASSIDGLIHNENWDGRESKTFRIETTYADAMNIFQDGVNWSIICETVEDESDEILIEEFNNGEFNVAGDVTDHRDGTISVTMGKMTDLEEAYELLYGGE